MCVVLQAQMFFHISMWRSKCQESANGFVDCLEHRRFETLEQSCASCSGCRKTKLSSAWACRATSSRLCVFYMVSILCLCTSDGDLAAFLSPTSYWRAHEVLLSTTLLLCCRLRWAATMCVSDRQSLAQGTTINKPLTVAILKGCTHQLHGSSVTAPVVMPAWSV